MFHVAIIEDREDPLKLGRYRVRIFGAHTESLADIPTSSLPWAIPISNRASMSGIGQASNFVEGTLVYVFFQDEESKQMPIIIGSIAGIPVNKLTFPVGAVFDELITPIVDPIESIPPEEPPLVPDKALGETLQKNIDLPSLEQVNFVKEEYTAIIKDFDIHNVLVGPIISKYVSIYASDVVDPTISRGKLIRIFSSFYIARNMIYLSIGDLNSMDPELVIKNGINLASYLTLINLILSDKITDEISWVKYIKTTFPAEFK